MNNNISKFKMRQIRKNEHIKYFLESNHKNNNYFQDIILQNNSLPEIDFNEIDTNCKFLNKNISFPLMINAITGGTEEAAEINESLAKLAKKFNIPIAVGSQSLALKSSEHHNSYKIVKDIIENGIVISNLSAKKSYEDIIKVMDMLKADAVQLHLNVPQEICMKEGDRNFKGILKNIENIVQKISKPVIVKEVGFGISKQAAKQLLNVGVEYIDIGGKGGTNFIEIEDLRNHEHNFSQLYSWGIPTTASLIQCCSINSNLNIICSGGITKSEEIIKSLCIGANIVGISGLILKELLSNGYKSSEKLLQDIIYKTKIIMLLVGAKDIDELRNIPYIVKGELKDLINI
jgi:isopentenyl-diphosphate delta-isomerase